MSRTVHIVSLGCAKNRVDSEVLLGLLERAGYSLITDPEEAELVVVNTCGFIEPAREESVDAVLEAARLRQRGRLQTLLVAGCLVQRYGEELAAALPEADKLIGTADLAGVLDLLSGPERLRWTPGPSFLYDHTYEREPSLGPHTAYVKIAEGCDRPCAFCAVPAIRGRQRSRAPDDVVIEVRALVGRGVREVNLVAQDLTAYGRDRELRHGLARLLEALREIPGLCWLRLLYAYPSEIDDHLLGVLSEGRPVIPYLDVPPQHVDDELLRRMRRGYTGALVRGLPDRLRRAVPGIFLRTTFLVGHPGESDAAFARLEDFLTRAGLDHVGVFPFSPEKGTAAVDQDGQVPAAVARERAARLMKRQREISRALLSRLVGRTLEILTEGPSEESDLLGVGRHPGQAPEVDGVTLLADDPDLSPGRIVTALVEQAGDYDLMARLTAPDPG